MISFNIQSNPQQSHTGIFINQHITVQTAAEATGYNIQYLRRMLRSGALKGVKIGQMWLIEMDALVIYLKRVESTSDRRCGKR
jgi:excisionase family DNA binding protein